MYLKGFSKVRNGKCKSNIEYLIVSKIKEIKNIVTVFLQIKSLTHKRQKRR